MDRKLLNLALILLICMPGHAASSLDGRKLAAAGILITEEKSISVYTSSLTGTIVVKLLPNLPTDKRDCMKDAIASYNKTLTSILTPLGDSIRRIQDSTQESEGSREERIIGAILGGAALGVATAAQITAASALIQANQNAANILRLKESISATNEAVHEVTKGVSQLTVAMGKMQAYVNEQFNKTGEALDCLKVSQQIGVELSLYLTELTTVFGPQITSPALSPITIQALYNLAGGSLDYILNKMGVGNSQLNSLISSGLITGSPILYDSATQLLGIQITLPSVSGVRNLRAVFLETLAVHTPKGYASALVPRVVTTVGSVIEELEMSYCITAGLDLYCTRVLTYPLSQGITRCLTGNVSSCSYSKTEGALTTPYMTLKGSVVANCKLITCRCEDPKRILTQNYGEAVTLIDSSLCRTISLEGVTLRLTGTFDSSYERNITVSDDQVLITGNLDISTELGNVNNSINNALDKLEESNEKLSRVNVKLMSTNAMITYIVLTVIALVLGIIGLGMGCYVLYKQKAQQKTLLWLGNNTLQQMKASTKM
nr:fusion protein [Orthoavulavirus sp.]